MAGEAGSIFVNVETVELDYADAALYSEFLTRVFPFAND